MSLAELGSLGEFLASIVVLITLIYLAIQTRSTKQSIELQQILAATQPSIEINNTVAANPHFAEAIRKSVTDELNEEQRYLYYLFIYNHMTVLASVVSAPESDARSRMLLGYEPSIRAWWQNDNFVKIYEEGGFQAMPEEVLRFLEQNKRAT